MAIHNLQWVCSYETLKFNTSDGDLHKDQYAVEGEDIYIRKHPENNENFFCIAHADNKDGVPLTPEEVQAELVGKVEVQIIPNEHQYFDKFKLPDGRFYRIKTTEKDYKDLAKAGAKAKEKKVTDQEIIDIEKEDNLWQ